VANAGGPYSGSRNQAIAFNGSASSDPEDDALTYSWNFGDGTIGSGASPTHAYPTAGTYTATLVVNDGTVDSSPATATVTLANQAPVANAGGPYSGSRNQAITFNGSGSTDPEGDTLSYSWDFGDGSTATGVAPTHAYVTVGTFMVTLTVNDGATSSIPATASVTISNRNPSADAGPDQTIELGASATLNGSGSDPDGDSLTYEWRDASTNIVGTSPSLSGTFPLGSQTFTLTVRDNQGGSAADAAVVTVRDTTAPTVTITSPSGTQIFTGMPYTITWAASDNGVLASFDVAVSSNGGASFTAIPGCTGLAGSSRSCVWSSPGPATSQGRVLVTARDESGNSGSGLSSFTAVDPVLTVTSPNTAANWGLGSTRVITWTSNLGAAETVNVELSRNGGVSWETLASGAANTGSFNWIVAGATTASARVRASWAINPSVSDQSDADFTIAVAFVTVTVPNTLVKWDIGTVQTISWTHNLSTAATMRIEVSRDGGATWSLINASVPNNADAAGRYDWSVTGPNTSRARIRVAWNTNPTVTDISNVNFQIH
jgi:PKD repeat protein